MTLEITRHHLEQLSELSFEPLLGNKTGFMQINLELRPPYIAFISLLHSYMMVCEYNKLYSWHCPWLFQWPDPEEEYPAEEYQNDVYEG